MPLISSHELSLIQEDWEETVADCLITIQRNTATGTNPDGHPVAAVWVDHIVNLAARWWDLTEFERGEAEFKGPIVNAIVPMGQILVPVGTDVTEQDRIKTLVNLLGDTILRNSEIEYVQARDPYTILAVKDWHS